MIIRFGSIPSLLLLNLSFIPSFVLAASSASSAASPPVFPPSARSISLVDLLNDSPEHSMLLSALQRARLIPAVNLLNGSVLWAPTNDAIRAEIEHEKRYASQLAAQHSAERHRPSLNCSTSSDVVRATNPPIWPVWSYAVHGVSALMTSNHSEERDNLQLELRHTLLYHMFNYSLFPPPHDDTPPPSDNRTSLMSNGTGPFDGLPLDRVILHETLYRPSLSSFNQSFPAPPTLPGSPPDNPDPDKPHKVEGLLRGQGQRVRVVRKSATKKGSKEEVWIGGDWRGEGGAVADNKVLHATNGALVFLTAVLHRPVDLAAHIRTNPDLSTFASLLPEPLLNYIATAPHLTLFAPTNEAWASLSDLELKYLKSKFAEKDLIEIFGAGASREGVGKGKVGYISSLFGKNSTHTTTAMRTIWNSTLEIAMDESNNVVVNGTRVGTPDILALNGVIHTVPTLLLPSGSLSLTAEKYLIALEAIRFVSLLHSVNLSHYVQNSSGDPAVMAASYSSSTSQSIFAAPDGAPAYTILAPPDSVLQNEWKFLEDADAVDGTAVTVRGGSLPPAGSDALKEFLLYSIVSGKWLPEDLKDGMLVGTELRGPNLRDARQRLAVNVNVASQNLASIGWGWWSSGDPNSERKPGLVGFGGVSVIREPVVVGNTVIYLISSTLEPPAPIINQAVSDLRLSTFVASVYAASLDHTLAHQPAVTCLVPDNEAFTSLGLVMSYLLLPTARAELRSLVRYHAINEIVYFEDFPRTGAARYPTLDSGAEIFVRQDNGTVLVHGPTSGGLATNGEVRDARLIEGNILTATGAVHVIDQVELPPTLNITPVKLMRGAKASTMLELIRAANMTWVLEGRSPPPTESLLNGGKNGEKDKKAKVKPEYSAYTILCPTDKALSHLNISYYHANPPLLEALIRLHVIPVDPFMPLKPDGRPLTLADDASYPTLLDRSEGGESRYGSIAFRRWGDDGWLVGISGARGTGGESDSAKIVSYGRATPSFVDIDGQGRRLAGGGVLMIDSVLLPYNPGWFRRFGWIILIAVLGTALVALTGWGGWRYYRRSRKPPYEPLEGEEE